MRHPAYQALAIAAAATAALVARDARACSPPIPYLVSQRLVAPASGAIRVPLNAVVTVAYAANLGMSTVPLDHPVLRSASGVAVTSLAPSTSPRLFTASSPALLEPNMRYEVLSEIPAVPCFGAATPDRSPACWPTPATTGGVDGGTLDAGELDGGAATVDPAALALREIAYFTTGDTTDETAPASPGPLTITKSPTSCHGGGCCFDYEGIGIRIDWPPAQDDSGIGYYEITTPDGQPLPLQTATGIQSIVMCSSQYTFGGIDIPGKYQLVAVDLAGHRSPPVTIDLSDTCDGGSGCGCRIGGPGQPAAVSACLALAILLLAARRWRRRQAQRTPAGSPIPLP